MWKLEDIIENIIIGSKFKNGMFLHTRTEIDNQTVGLYVNVNGRDVIIDTDPSLSTTDDTYNTLYNRLKSGLKGFKINIKTSRKRMKRMKQEEENGNNMDIDNEFITSTKIKKRGRHKSKRKKSKSE